MFQVRIPVKSGGLGLTSLSSTQHIAYFASVVNAIKVWQIFIENESEFFTRWLTPPWEGGDATQATKELANSMRFVRRYINNANDPQAANLHVSSSITNNGDLKQIKKSLLASRLPNSITGLLTFADIKKLQHRISMYLQTTAIQRFEKEHLTTQAHKAHYLSKTGPHAAAFLQTIQSEKAMTFNNTEYLVILYTYLQMDVLALFNADPTTICACGGLDSQKRPILCTESHLLNCGANNDFTRRHDVIKELFMDMFRTAGYFPQSEKQCDVGSGNFSRFDITIENVLHANKILNLDITIPNPCAKKAVAASSVKPLVTADNYVKRKNAKYSKYVGPDNFFTPVVIEAYGAMHPLTEGVIRRTSHLVSHKPPPQAAWTAPNFSAYYFQRISCALQKMNASSIINVITSSANLSKSSPANGQPRALPTADYVYDEVDFYDVVDISQDQQAAGPEPAL
jgi:hypothetical protein